MPRPRTTGLTLAAATALAVSIVAVAPGSGSSGDDGDLSTRAAGEIEIREVDPQLETALAEAKRAEAEADVAEASAEELADREASEPGPAEVQAAEAEQPEEPQAEQQPAGAVHQTGEASWYGPGFAGNTTANGETYDPRAMTAAHRSLPFGTQVQVTNLNNGSTVTVRINDRGPYAGGRIIDLSEAAAEQIGMRSSGVAQVELRIVG
jgi:rare lipoprotein A